MKNRRILITGGAGFIGSNLAETLCEENNVAVVDNLSTGCIENIDLLVKKKKIEFVKGSVTDLSLMKKILRDVEYVFHHAAVPSVPRSVKEPLSINESGITGTLTALIASRDCGVKKFIYASSSSVYGDTPTLPKREDMVPNPLSPYALTKLTGEHYCKLFTELYGLKTVSLRYFNVYGPRQDPNSEYAAVIPRFITCALANKPLTVYGDGKQTRDFTFVKDAVQANIKAAESSATGNYNIAGGKRISINSLAKTILRITKSHSRVLYEPPRPGDIKHSLADISRARSFGYEPEYSLEEGLKESIRWFKENI